MRADFVKETTTTEGLGAYTLDGAAVGFQSFVTAGLDTETVVYAVTDGVDFEVASGVVSDGLPDTLSRVSVLASSNGGAPINWGAGTKTIKQVVSASEFDEFLTEETPIDHLIFDTTSTYTVGAGEVAWNDADGTLDIGLEGGNVTLQVGQEIVVKAKADADISDGEVVYVTGAVGASGRMTVDLFIADGSIDEIRTLGIATEDIANNNQGYITTQGSIRGISTDGSAVSETWTDGTVLYPSPTTAGALTSTEPEAPNLAIAIAIVINAHPNNGTIYVHPRIGEHLGELHDVYAPTPSDGHVLTWVAANSRYEVIAPTVADDSVTNAKLANMATSTIKGRVTAGTGDPQDLSVAQVQTLIGGSGLDADTLDGVEGANYLRTDNTGNKSVNGNPYLEQLTLTDGATITWDFRFRPEAFVTLGGNRTLELIENPPNGAWLTIVVKQDGTGSRTLSYASVFSFGDAGTPVLSTGAGKSDILTFRCRAGKALFVGIASGFPF